MELRSRGALKVVWRSSRHFVCSSQLSLGKALYPREEEFSWPSGSGSYGEESGGVLEDPRSASKEIAIAIIISTESLELQEPAAATGKPSAPLTSSRLR